MASRGARLEYLEQAVDQLAGELERAGRIDEVLDAAEQLRREPHDFRIVDDVEWEHLTREEQRRLLPARYLTLRTELEGLEREGRSKHGQQLRDWLDGPAPRVAALLAASSADH